MTYDVVVVGGGPAGPSGAVARGRALRSALVIDAATTRNAPADGIHNYLTRDGIPPAEFAALGRAEVRRFGGTFADTEVIAVTRDGDLFSVASADGPAGSEAGAQPAVAAKHVRGRPTAIGPRQPGQKPVRSPR
jgi:thioredoxin reductase